MAPGATRADIESPDAWLRLPAALALMTIGGSGMYAITVVLPRVQADFAVSRGDASLAYTLTMIGFASMLPLALVLRRPAPPQVAAPVAPGGAGSARPMGLSPAKAQALLCVAGVACCVAMSVPQVHIVAYCGDLGFGAARGAQMLSLMLGMGVLSRLVSGWISDRIGGLRTLMLGSILQGIALLMFLPAKGLVPLYLVSAMFGLFQGGIVPAYALIVREHFAPEQAGARVGTVLMATLLGMALGGWMSGAIFDWTGSYQAAFVNGIAWNALNLLIVGFLLLRVRALPRPLPA